MIRPSVRPMRSNEDLISALKKRRISEKNKPKEGKLIDISLLIFRVIENLACVKCKLECLFGCLNFKLNNMILSFAFKTIIEFRFNKDAVNIVAHSCSDFEFCVFFLAVNTGFTISNMTWLCKFITNWFVPYERWSMHGISCCFFLFFFSRTIR